MHNNTQQTSAQQATDSQTDHSYDLVIDLLRDQAKAQSDQINTLDNKANGIMTIASGLLAASLVLQAAWLSLSKGTISVVFAHTQGFMITLLIVYLLLMIIATISGYWMQNLKRSPEPGGLVNFATQPKLDTQSAVTGSMVDAMDDNDKISHFKSICLRIAVILLILEIILLGILLFMQLYV